MDLSVLGVFFSHPPPHSEEEVARREAVSTQRVTEGVLRSVSQLQTPVGVSEGLWDQKEMQIGIRLVHDDSYLLTIQRLDI